VTVLFVPLESGLIAALEEDASIYTEALDKRVIITTASTLLALLRTCALQWQQAKLNENARRIGDSARELLGRISVFAEHLEKVGKGLETASKAYNSAVGSFNGRLLPGARETAELAGDRERVPAELEPAATVLREANVRSLPGGG
jgi:DNA recombination protein RmuC